MKHLKKAYEIWSALKTKYKIVSAVVLVVLLTLIIT